MITQSAFKLAGKPGHWSVLHYTPNASLHERWHCELFGSYVEAMVFFLNANAACLFDTTGQKIAETVKAEQ